RRKMDNGQFPGRELSDGAAILVAGAFLISPGFITDLLGFLLLIPVVQGAIYRIFSNRFTRRVSGFTAKITTVRQDRSRGSRSIDDLPGRVIDIDGHD
ncbi:MAG: FxsA family protein, partial [Acidimicrobiia bacterium]